MTDPQRQRTMLVLFIGAITLGFPIAFTLMALGLGFGYMGMGDAIFSLFVQRTYAVMSNDVLISIPLFVFMGYLVERANILDRLFRSIQMTFGACPVRWRLPRWPHAPCSPPPPASSAPR